MTIYTDQYTKHEMAVFEAVKTYLTETMPDFPWGRFWDLSRSLNAELWHGPLGTEYWGADGADPAGRRWRLHPAQGQL